MLAVAAREDDDADLGRHQRAPLRADASRRRRCARRRNLSRDADHRDGRHFDDGVGEQAVGHLDGTVTGGGLVGRLDREAEGLAHTDVVDAFETQRRQGPLDGRTLRIGDPGAQPDLHEHLVLHVRITCSHRTSRPIGVR